jgi:hypothetical protein
VPSRKRSDPNYNFVRRALITIGLATLALLLWQLRTVLVLLFGAVVMGTIIRAISEPLSKHLRLPDGVAVLVSVLMLVGLLVGVGWLLGQQISAQTDTLAKTLPRALEQVDQWLGNFGLPHPFQTWLAPFGEPIVKAFVDEVLSEARKLENQLRSLRTDRSVVVLHYAPIMDTIEGEPPAIFQYLGSQRLCEPIDRFDHVKAVVHGHAHHGTYEGRTPLGRPVYNVAQFVLRPKFGKPYIVLEI